MLSSITFLDFESELSAPGWKIPFPAIATTFHVNDGARLWLTHQIPELIERLLRDETTAIGGHNLATFDCPIIAEHLPWLRPALWRAIEEGRVVDTMIAQRQIQINRGQKGPLNLGDCARAVGLPFVDKSDAQVKETRTSFGQFIGASSIPPAHAAYALDDAAVLQEMFERQFNTGLVSLRDNQQLVQQQFNLALVAARGIRTDAANVSKLRSLVNDKIAELQALAQRQGFLHAKPKADGTLARNMKAIHEAIARAYDPTAWPAFKAALDAKADLEELRRVAGKIPLTEKGNVCADRLTLEDAPSQELQDLSDWSQMLSVRNKDLPIFEGAVHLPAHTRFGIADTSRATSGGEDAFNAQNFGKLRGVRECIRARDGFALLSSDYKMLELVSLAQLCVERLGLTTMADKINSGVDMHAEIGADILGLSDDEFGGAAWREVKRRGKAGDHNALEARDAGKPANFGMNGGMSKAETFQLYARKSYGQRMTFERAEQVMSAWRKRAVDQQAWLESVKRSGYWVADPNADDGRRRAFDCPIPRFENLVRRALWKTEASNNPFQALGMRVAALGLHYVQREQYLPGGRMHGSHVMMFVHDDITSETPLALIDAHATVQEECMNRASREVCPAVWAGVDTKALSHLSKYAEATRDADGRLLVTQVSMPESLG